LAERGPISATYCRTVVLADIWRGREVEPGVTDYIPATLAVAARRAGAGWVLVRAIDSATGAEWAGELSAGEWQDVCGRLAFAERQAADDAARRGAAA
jgi:hypothetical protein